jgi:uncharacterized protein involved in type VI secretion and phage assembly
MGGGAVTSFSFPELTHAAPAGVGDGRWFGVHVAQVSDNQDPDGQGRVKIRLPWSPDGGTGTLELWARLATMMAGASRGTFFVPDPDDEVLVAFEGGDPDHPIVIGSLWNGQDAPPASIDARNTVKRIRSRNGVTITLSDEDGQESLKLQTPGGQSVELHDGPGTITVQDANGNRAVMQSSGVTLTVAATLTVNAAQVQVSAGMVAVDAGMSRFSGVVQCDTLITNSVVSASYTPGAGNIW